MSDTKCIIKIEYNSNYCEHMVEEKQSASKVNVWVLCVVLLYRINGG